MTIANKPMIRMTSQKSETLNSVIIIVDERIKAGLNIYSKIDKIVENIITQIIIVGKMLSNCAIKNSVIIPSGILKALPSLTGNKKTIIPNKEGSKNLKSHRLVISNVCIFSFFTSNLITSVF